MQIQLIKKTAKKDLRVLVEVSYLPFVIYNRGPKRQSLFMFTQPVVKQPTSSQHTADMQLFLPCLFCFEFSLFYCTLRNIFMTRIR